MLPVDDEQYSALWRVALVEQAEFFRIALEDHPEQHLPTHFAEDSFTIGAFEQNRLVGSVSIERDFRRKFRHKALLFKMYVHPDAAGQGAGRLLMLEAMQQAAKVDGLRQLSLTVLASNTRAIHLYRSLGFVEFAREPEAINISGTYVDELQMRHALPNANRDLESDSATANITLYVNHAKR